MITGAKGLLTPKIICINLCKGAFMNFEQLTYFTTVVEEGTISGAARRLNMTQPPLSLQLHNLEEEFGLKLFERGARQIRLTEAGHHFYDDAIRILDLRDNAAEEMKNLRTGRKGSLRIGVVSSASCEEFFQGLERFRKSHEKIQFKIYDGNTYQLLNALEKQKIELAVIRTPFPSAELDILNIKTDRIIAAATEQYMEKLPKGTISLGDLKAHPLIIYRRWEKLLKECFAKLKINPDFKCVNDDARTTLQWAEAGVGVALLPASIMPLAHNLRFRELEEDELTSTICIAKRRDRILSESAEAFFECFRGD